MHTFRKKPREYIRYRGGRHLPPPRRIHPDHPLSPLGYKMSNGTSQTSNADKNGWLRPQPRRKPPIPYAKHGECNVTTCHSGETLMASSVTAEMSPIRQKSKWLIHGTYQKTSRLRARQKGVRLAAVCGVTSLYNSTVLPNRRRLDPDWPWSLHSTRRCSPTAPTNRLPRVAPIPNRTNCVMALQKSALVR